MKILVVYYSRTGTTRKLAKILSEKLKCDIEEIIDRKGRKGIVNYLIAGRDAMEKKLTKISAIQKDIKSYNIVVIGTPIWAWNLPPAVRTFILENKNNLKKAAFFATGETSGADKIFKDLEDLCGQKSIATLFMKKYAGETKNTSLDVNRFIHSVLEY